MADDETKPNDTPNAEAAPGVLQDGRLPAGYVFPEHVNAMVEDTPERRIRTAKKKALKKKAP